MPQSNASLAALIGSRICHDLISPVGAIANGLELLSLTNVATRTPEMDLIQTSCDNANARIRLFRVAFGSAGDASLIATQEVRRILADLQDDKYQITWSAEAALPRNQVQLALLAVMCAQTALPYGGAIGVQVKDRRFCIWAKGKTLLTTGPEWTSLTDPAVAADGVAAGKVHFTLLQALSAEMDRPVEHAMQSGRLEIQV